MAMPKIDLRLLHSTLQREDYAIIRRITDLKTWRLRASRPGKTDSDEACYADYVWRMVALVISPRTQHHCMPVCATFYLPKDTGKVTVQHLDSLTDKITATVPSRLWHGVIAWAGMSSDPNFDKRAADSKIRNHAILRGE